MRAAWFHNSRQSSEGPPQSWLCYFDTARQWGGHWGQQRQWFTNESGSDLTWIKCRNSGHWLQPSALWRNVSGSLVGEVRTARSTTPAWWFLMQGGLFTETGWAISPQLASTTPSCRSTATQLHVHQAVMQTDGDFSEHPALTSIASKTHLLTVHFKLDLIWPVVINIQHEGQKADINELSIHTHAAVMWNHPRQTSGWWQFQTGSNGLTNGGHMVTRAFFFCSKAVLRLLQAMTHQKDSLHIVHVLTSLTCPWVQWKRC